MGKNYTLMGLPSSGKTTFLAAFWHVLHLKEFEKSFCMSISSDDMEYLNNIRDEWLSFKKVTRNNKLTVEKSIIHVKYDSDVTVDLSIPDFSGEIYKEIVKTRIIDNENLDMLNKSNGFMLFINPNLVIPSVFISQVNEAISIGENDQENIDPEPFDFEKVPTQVILVDLLQIIREYSLISTNKIKIAIIISAWDSILKTDMNITPMKWIKRQCPLFYQYIQTNSSFFQLNVYGISAQGGDYDVENELDKLMAINKPSDRIIVMDDGKKQNNITSPVKWLLNNE